MLKSNLYSNKKADVGKTLTWLIATIIIVIVLILFIYASSFLGSLNSLKVSVKKLGISDEPLRTNLSINTKTAMAYVQTTSDKALVDAWLDKNKVKIGDYINE